VITGKAGEEVKMPCRWGRRIGAAVIRWTTAFMLLGLHFWGLVYALGRTRPTRTNRERETTGGRKGRSNS